MFRQPKTMVERLTLSAFSAFAKTFLRSRTTFTTTISSIRHFFLTQVVVVMQSSIESCDAKIVRASHHGCVVHALHGGEK